MKQNICILGSTGSIGKQTLEVVKNLNLKVKALSANKNISLLEKQARVFKPDFVCVVDKKKALELKYNLKDTKTKVMQGKEGLEEIASLESVDLVVNSVVGNIGLSPTLSAIRAKKDLALANKEVLVSAGEFIMKKIEENGVNIYPIDSEHSAIFQCLQGSKHSEINKIILTASGGPFRAFKSLENVSLEDALKHPNWEMGKKITIDSATLMNKGLEVIEAKWLFDLPIEKIEVIVHPQSIIHSMIEYKDSSVIAQLGTPDMKVPIQYALAYPKRIENNFEKLDLVKLASLTFEKPNNSLFPCLSFAFDAIKKGGTLPAVLNASNEIAVHKFLKNEIKFTEIPKLIEETLRNHKIIKNYSIKDVFEADDWARNFTNNLV